MAENTCRICGCGEWAIGYDSDGPSRWVEADLCSACAAHRAAPAGTPFWLKGAAGVGLALAALEGVRLATGSPQLAGFAAGAIVATVLPVIWAGMNAGAPRPGWRLMLLGSALLAGVVAAPVILLLIGGAIR